MAFDGTTAVSTAPSAIERCKLPVSNHFPPTVRESLIAASRHFHPLDRLAAIQRATARARDLYPEMFNHHR